MASDIIKYGDLEPDDLLAKAENAIECKVCGALIIGESFEIWTNYGGVVKKVSGFCSKECCEDLIEVSPGRMALRKEDLVYPLNKIKEERSYENR